MVFLMVQRAFNLTYHVLERPRAHRVGPEDVLAAQARQVGLQPPPLGVQTLNDLGFAL